MSDKVAKSDKEWQAELTPEEYHVARQKGTERPFTGAYWDSKTPGTYVCVCCGSHGAEDGSRIQQFNQDRCRCSRAIE